MKIVFPTEYPLKKPILTLKNPERFFHPNIGPSSGSICHQMLKIESP